MKLKAAFMPVLLMFVACNDSGTGPGKELGIPDQAKAFADSHWVEAKFMDDRENPTEASWYGYWKGWYQENAICEDLALDMECSLPEVRDDEYYRLIGECQQFIYGWNDVHDNSYVFDPCFAPDSIIITWTDTLHYSCCIYDQRSVNREIYLSMFDSQP